MSKPRRALRWQRHDELYVPVVPHSFSATMRIALMGLGLSFFAMGLVGLFFGSLVLGGFGVVFLILAPILILLGLIMREVPEAFPAETQSPKFGWKRGLNPLRLPLPSGNYRS